MRVILLMAAVLAVAGPAEARSKAAQYLIDQEIAEACSGRGTIDGYGAVERDLTGDGRDDLIIFHDAISCETSVRSGFCGMQLCALKIYVRRGNLLKLEVDMMSVALEVSNDAVPTIGLASHGGESHSIRWDGKRFR